jgi:hypothetical protein
VTLERLADGSYFNRRYATGTILARLPGVETAGLKSAAAHAAKTKVFFQKCPDIRSLPKFLREIRAFFVTTRRRKCAFLAKIWVMTSA